jgi:hypothetical protein
VREEAKSEAKSSCQDIYDIVALPPQHANFTSGPDNIWSGNARTMMAGHEKLSFDILSRNSNRQNIFFAIP